MNHFFLPLVYSVVALASGRAPGQMAPVQPVPKMTLATEVQPVSDAIALPDADGRGVTPGLSQQASESEPPPLRFPLMQGSPMWEPFRPAPIFLPIGAVGNGVGPPLSAPREPYHWKGLLLQSLAFQGLQHGPRIAAADAADRHLLLNKPFWSNYRASLGQYNMRRWNDGDSFVVNYVGHPMQGAISGYIEVQNDPRGRDLRFSSDRAYWNSRFRAFLWETAYSTEFEIGPLSEASIFNQGGYTYPLGCKAKDTACDKKAHYTNNTGWVDFIVTPTGGTMMLIAGDAIDRYVSDRLIAKHPDRFRYKVLRAGLNPPRTMANLMRGRYPWYRDYEPPTNEGFFHPAHAPDGKEEAVAHHVDLQLFSSTVRLPDVGTPCRGCRRSVTGPGAEIGVHAGRFVDVVSTVRHLGSAGSLFPAKFGGSLLLAHFGLRTGFAGPRFALSASVMPGFASYVETVSEATAAGASRQTSAGGSGSSVGRSFLFSASGILSGEIAVSRRVALRTSVEQIVIRYKSDKRDAPGIGTPPRLSFLSHENYINQTNWGVRVGPVLRF